MDLGIRDKIFTITLDNASNNDQAMHRLKIFWQIKDDHSKLFHVRCCDLDRLTSKASVA